MTAGLRAALLVVLGLSVVTTSALGGSATTNVDGVGVELRSVPDAPIKDQKTTYTLRLLDAAGKPITDARVTLTGRMSDGMSTAAALRPASEPGVYRGEVLFTMAGPWDLIVRVVRKTGRVEIPLREDVASHK